MSKFEKDIDNIMALFHEIKKNRWSGKTVDGIDWVAGYMPSKKELVVILGDREDSHKNTRIVIKDGERDKLFKTFKELYGDDKISNEEEMTIELNETASCGCTCAGSVATIAKPIGKTIKRKKHGKKKKVSEGIDAVLFKESILNDMPCETKIGEYSFKYFFNEGKWYMGVNNSLVKTYDKAVMMETFDQIVDEEKVTTSLLEDYSCYEMDILMEDGNEQTNIDDSTKQNNTQQASNSVGNGTQQNTNNSQNNNQNTDNHPIIPQDKREEGETAMRIDSTYSDTKYYYQLHLDELKNAIKTKEPITVFDFNNKNGNQIQGTVEKVEDDKITVKLNDGKTKVYNSSNVKTNRNLFN